MSDPAKIGVSRRTLAKGAAWTVPAAAVVAAAPAYAVSLRKDPGINGWVLNTPTSRGNCWYYLEVDSTRRGTGPDGAPYGLYVYDVEDPNVITNAKITYWIIGEQREGATWTTLSGHSSCWSGPVKGAAQTKRDGLVYTPYTWTYTCDIDSTDRRMDSDGVERLYLGHFHVQASFRQPSGRCNNVTYWTQRHITIDPDGAGSHAPEVHTFERRNGTFGTCTGRPGTNACRTS